MRAFRFQQTLSRPCQVTGRGYWSSQPITVTFMPAPVGTGVQFVRTDLAGQPRVEAIADHRVDMSLRTRLVNGPAMVDMIEHVMAALYALRIDNVEVHCNNCEMPGLDGSSHAFVLALESAGRTQQKTQRATHVISQPMRVGNESQWVVAYPAPPSQGLTIEYQLDYGPDSSIASCAYTCPVSEFSFVNELADARTFLTKAEAEHLQSKGVAGHVTTRDLLVFGDNGPIDNELRYPDECARHKALDLLGDLALAGVDLVGRIVAHRSGHQLNAQLAGQLRQSYFTSTQAKTFKQSDIKRRIA